MKSLIFLRLQIAAAIHILRGIAMRRNVWLLQPFTTVQIIFVFFFQFVLLITHQLLNMLNIKSDTNQHNFKIVDLHFAKSE